MTEVDATLKERGSRYGRFDDQARVEQAIKRAFADSPNWATLKDDAKAALEMAAVKISRILKGDPDYADNWHDVQGYFKLVEDRINGTGEYAGQQAVWSARIPKCSECFARYGDVHAPDCPFAQASGDLGRGTRC